MKRKASILILLALLMLTGSVLAMESANYQLTWFTPLTGSGGKVSSSNYTANFTVGQSTIGTTSSTNYEGCLGYWCGDEGESEYTIYLPLVFRLSQD